MTNWNDERTKLREKFTTGEVMKAKRKELEWYLVVLANTIKATGTNEYYHQESAEFANVIRHLLQVRLGEELHEKSHRISVLALGVALAAAAFAGFESCNVYESRQQTTPLSAPAKSSEPSLPEKSSAPSMQPAPYIALTNSKAISQTTSTNR